jgi:hypothetical protein
LKTIESLQKWQEKNEEKKSGSNLINKKYKLKDLIEKKKLTKKPRIKINKLKE